MTLAGKHILLGISGGIAAYKTPMLVRQLRQAGAEVQVVLSQSAHHFVAPHALAAVTGSVPRSNLFDLAAEAAMGHIELARWADAVLIAPATAHCVAQLAHGFAGDLLSTICLATRAPVLLAPAMNVVMWEAAAVQDNICRLKEHGRIVLGPASGEQACGEVGLGRMLEPDELVIALQEQFNEPNQPLRGLRFTITAGPTREAIDPVRFISNHSSGKQGYAIASAAASLGAEVTLISGPTALAPPSGVTTIRVESAQEMLAAALQATTDCDVFIGVAAVADYRPATIRTQKIKRNDDGLAAIPLVQNPDIIASVASLASRPTLVAGFAAETNDALRYAREKRVRKGLDAIVVNDVSDHRIGFNSEMNAATLITADHEHFFPTQAKSALAEALVLELAEMVQRRLAPTNP
jgi:phosphopantothenoylcysteine decarboxylase / phosphopantothenate---cysteine ligase